MDGSEDRDELLTLLALITDVLRSFSSHVGDDLDRVISDALHRIGTFSGVDRSYLFLASDDRGPERWSNSHEWCAPGIQPQMDGLQDIPTGDIRWVLEPLQAGAPHVYVPDVLGLPESMEQVRRELASQGIRSLVVVPVLDGERLVAMLGFDAVRAPRRWSDGAMLLLRAVADVICHALARQRAEAALRHQALHDPLTGLANRTLLLERLRETLQRRTRTSGSAMDAVGLVFIDLDRFKRINDAAGHLAGDQLLVEVGRRLLQQVRGRDTVARFGGDEFVVLLDGAGSTQAIQAAADRLMEAFSAPFQIDGCDHLVTASAGLVLSDGWVDDPEAFVRDADAAMYQAKERGRACLQRFDAPLRDRLLAHVELGDDLHGAGERGELELAFQPLVDLSSNRVVGAEALVRWNHPTRGRLTPVTFIPIAEESGSIVALGQWVLGDALRQLRAWDDAWNDAWNDEAVDLSHLVVSVNLSVHQLTDTRLPATVARLLAAHDIEPHRLCLELTESALMAEPARARVVLDDLRGIGVRLAIDDFGTGYSSLAYLRDLPVDTLKIDRSFVAGIGTTARDTRLMGAIVGLARDLGLTTVAEGVETLEQLAVLRALGCEVAQGYHLGVPGPPADVAAAVASAPDGVAAPLRTDRTTRAARTARAAAIRPA